MDRERIVTELPEADRETFKVPVDDLETQAALIEPSKAKASFLRALLSMRKRLTAG